MNRFETLSRIPKNEEGREEFGELVTSIKTQEETEGNPRHLADMEYIETKEIVAVVEDMKLGELDLERVEKTCDYPKTGYIPFI
jgi:hypothetical protein